MRNGSTGMNGSSSVCTTRPGTRIRGMNAESSFGSPARSVGRFAREAVTRSGVKIVEVVECHDLREINRPEVWKDRVERAFDLAAKLADEVSIVKPVTGMLDLAAARGQIDGRIGRQHAIEPFEWPVTQASGRKLRGTRLGPELEKPISRLSASREPRPRHPLRDPPEGPPVRPAW